MDVLIIDDMEEKNELIRAAIDDERQMDFTWTRSISSAYTILSETAYDLILLDMVFAPAAGSRDSSHKLGLAGMEILQFMAVQLLETPVIIVTSHDKFIYSSHPNGISGQTAIVFESPKLFERFLKAEYPNLVIGVVKIDENRFWKQKLSNMIGPIARSVREKDALEKARILKLKEQKELEESSIERLLNL